MNFPFRIARRLKDFLCLIPRYRVCSFSCSVDLIIVDRVGADAVSRVIPRTLSHWTLPVRDEERYISLAFLFHFFGGLPHVFHGKINMLGLYVLAWARTRRAAVLVTFIDNSSWDKNLHLVSDLRIVCIQNGIRPTKVLRRKHYDVFLSLGQREAEITKDISVLSKAVGSMNLARAFEGRSLATGDGDDKNLSIDLLFISQYRRQFWNSAREEDVRHVKAVKTTLQWMGLLAKEKGLRVGIGFSSKGSDREALFNEEKEIYDEFLAQPYQIFRREGFKQRGHDCTYGGLFRTKVVITFSSSMTVEAIGFNKPVVMTTRLLGNISSEHYDWFPAREFAHFQIEPTFESFHKQVLSSLLTENLRRPPYPPEHYCVSPAYFDTLGNIESAILDLIPPTHSADDR